LLPAIPPAGPKLFEPLLRQPRRNGFRCGHSNLTPAQRCALRSPV
jgi:hypothetical protein